MSARRRIISMEVKDPQRYTSIKGNLDAAQKITTTKKSKDLMLTVTITNTFSHYPLSGVNYMDSNDGVISYQKSCMIPFLIFYMYVSKPFLFKAYTNYRNG